jgi:hypothetical protein
MSLTQNDIEAANDELCRMKQNQTFEGYLLIGRYVFERFFAANEQEWRKKSSTKNNSLRRLEKLPNRAYRRTALADRVNVYLAMSRLAFVRESTFFSPRHVSEILRLEQSDQEPMLRRAEAQRWTPTRLHEEITGVKRLAGERRGRRSSPSARKALRKFAQALRSVREGRQLIESLNDLDEKTKVNASSTLTALVREANGAGCFDAGAEWRRSSPVAKAREEPLRRAAG